MRYRSGTGILAKPHFLEKLIISNFGVLRCNIFVQQGLFLTKKWPFLFLKCAKSEQLSTSTYGDYGSPRGMDRGRSGKKSNFGHETYPFAEAQVTSDAIEVLFIPPFYRFFSPFSALSGDLPCAHSG